MHLWGFQVPVHEFKSGLALKKFLKNKGYHVIVRWGEDPFFYYAEVVYPGKRRVYEIKASCPSLFLAECGAFDLLC